MSVRALLHPDDLPALKRLFEACLAHDGVPPLSEHKYRSLIRNDPVAEGLVADEDGTLVAYVHLLESKLEGTFELEIATHPGHRGTVEESMVEAALARIRRLNGDTVYAWSYSREDGEKYRRLGFEPVRDLHQLRVALPVDAPDSVGGIDIRPYVAANETALLRLNNAAFENHPEAGNWTTDDLNLRQGYDWHDPEGIRMAWDGERLVGFCWTKAHAGGFGEIYLIATSPDARGRGLGRELVLEGLRFLRVEKGSTMGLLYVDAANESAMRLYGRIGFQIHHTDRAFRLSL